MMKTPSDKTAFKIWRDRTTFLVYLIAALFMILFSVSAVQKWTAPWNHISIFVACLLPISLLIFGKVQDGFRSFQFSSEFLFIITILVLGVLNIIFSDNRSMSLHGMGLFLMSGIFSFIATRLLYDYLRKQSLLIGEHYVVKPQV